MANSINLLAPMTALVSKVLIKEGDLVSKGQELVILEAMKMENALVAEQNGKVNRLFCKEGDTIQAKSKVLSYSLVEPSTSETLSQEVTPEETDLIKELNERKKYLHDKNRPQAVEKRRKKNQNTARENIGKLVDPGTFKEYGGLIVAAQSSRRTMDDLIRNTPADGLVAGVGTINGDLVDDKNQCLVMAYDFTVLAGTQGSMNHVKMDRMLDLAIKNNLPTILFAEGGGGRPGDVDVTAVAGLYINTFYAFAKLGIDVPTVSIVSGYCFAGNAALAGSSDLIIGTENISIGMGGPAMVEGGGLGKFHPREIGPAESQSKNGVIDILVKDEDEAIEVAKKYLSYYQGSIKQFAASDQDKLQHYIPQNRKRAYDIRSLIQLLADQDSVLELRPEYGKGLITAMIRIEGHAIGLMANNSSYEAGAITSENAIKACEFMELCDKNNLPILSLVDTPGIMVGPEAEKSGTVKHASKMFKTSAKLSVPIMGIVVRRAYGLGAMAMVGGGMHVPNFVVSWPTGEFGAMGLEGAVKLGYSKELAAVTNDEERAKLFDEMVKHAYERGKATSAATQFEIDDVIEPKDTRSWVSTWLKTINQ